MAISGVQRIETLDTGYPKRVGLALPDSPPEFSNWSALSSSSRNFEPHCPDPDSQSMSAPAPYTLRSHRPGDLGWIIHRQGILYYEEYGWDERFEALVAEICARFIQNENPARERCWVAERNGEIVGAVFCVAKSDVVAQLRLLYVEPSARGLGLGNRLVDECIDFARRAGYRKIELLTNDVLHSARRIYEAKGFRLVEEEKHHTFGKDLVARQYLTGQLRKADLNRGLIPKPISVHRNGATPLISIATKTRTHRVGAGSRTRRCQSIAMNTAGKAAMLPSSRPFSILR